MPTLEERLKNHISIISVSEEGRYSVEDRRMAILSRSELEREENSEEPDEEKPMEIRDPNRQTAGGIILDPSLTKILLVKNRVGKWGPPKGGIEEGETAFQAAMREIYEETGLTIEADVPMAPCITIPNRRTRLFLFCFPKEACNLGPVTTDEIKDCQWFELEDIHRIPRTNLLRDVICSKIRNIVHKIHMNRVNNEVIDGVLRINRPLVEAVTQMITEGADLSDHTLTRMVLKELEDRFPLVFYRSEMEKYIIQQIKYL